MERTNKYVLKARNIWRERKRLIIMVGVAALVGVAMATVNTWNYEKATSKYESSERQVISNTESAKFYFSLEKPELAADTNIFLEISNPDAADLVLTVNGQQVESPAAESVTVQVTSEVLQENNTVVLDRREVAFEEQALESARVESYTNLQQLLFVALNFSALLLVFLPFGALKYREFQKAKKMEAAFPSFLRDVVEGTRAGMSLPQAVQNTTDSSYGPLDPRIHKMSAQIEWGVPFDEVLDEFGRKTKSSMVQRSVDTIIQAYTSGGDIQQVLESVGDNIRSIKQLKEERQSQLYGELITGYVVYLIFIGILIGLVTYLLPNLASASQSLSSTGGGLEIGVFGGGSGNLQENINLYKTWFSRLVYIQAIFSGLIIGKLSSGEFRAGLKHVAILFAIGYLSTTLFF